MKERLIIDGEEFTLVRAQRSLCAVYSSRDKYLRIGPASRIQKDLEVHRTMEQLQFPVATISAEGTIDDDRYFVEESLGETFRVRFENEFKSTGKIADRTFDEFVAITERYVDAQTKAVMSADRGAFARGVHLLTIQEELPEYAERIQVRFDQALRTIEQFPFVFSHGDFNPSNISARGVLDLEDAISAPLGFDVTCALVTIDWFPESGGYEYEAPWRFSDAQRTRYIFGFDARLKASGHAGFAAAFDDFSYCRALWMAARMHKFPKTQKWRYEKLIREYL